MNLKKKQSKQTHRNNPQRFFDRMRDRGSLSNLKSLSLREVFHLYKLTYKIVDLKTSN